VARLREFARKWFLEPRERPFALRQRYVDTKVINAYNEKNQKLVASGLLIVDAAVEPLRVLKVLVEGLPHGRSGLWLTNFKGIPVARTLSPFDLIYLASDYHVVHCVEISTEGEYEPFRGDPASALVVPSKSIASSRLRAGDRLMFRTVDPSDELPQPSTKSTRAARKAPLQPAPATDPSGAHFYNSSFPVPSGDAAYPGFLGQQAGGASQSSAQSATAFGEQSPTATAPNSSVSGRLTKSANSLLGTSSAFRPSSEDEPGAPQPGLGMGSIATQSPAPVELSFSVKAPTRLVSPSLANGAQDHLPNAHSSGAMASGRLMRSVNLAPAILPAEEPEAPVPATHPALGSLTIREVEPAEATPDKQEVASAAAGPIAPIPPEKSREPLHGIVIPFAAPAPSVAHHALAPETEATAVIPIAASPQPSGPAAAIETPAVPKPAAESEIGTPADTAIESAALFIAPQETAKTVPQVQAPPANLSQPIVSSPPAKFYQPAASVQTPQPAPPLTSPAAPPAMVPPAPAAAAQPQIAPQQVNAPPAAQPSTGLAIQPVKVEPSPYPRTQIKPAEQQQSIEVSRKKQKHSWDVRLLYSLFPEFDPSRPPEIRIPRIGEERQDNVEDEEQMSTKLRLLCWLYPDLHLEKVKEKRSEIRRAVRLPMPGLVAYFFTGGAPRPHPIKDISVTGFYMCTTERWLPGTIIRVTLQMVDPRSDGGRDSVTVHSRVVRWGPDGGGFEFVLPGFLEDR
jgi:hypothetical protein